ncbi:pathogen-associated molecular patterns-induced protein A70-like [Phragmites australis]|uniref:pathogen-associated molecular patterns-induced protein A70-like n=1 Tax=Phragmites australis TaxID=29695 RepID=UPI002D77B2C8|nr:pathogen-associated molecular patterns-induced protein A70-like [Phragmites australis]
MLEAAIPALWTSVHGFFTPAVLFIVLNIVIGTIAVTSKVGAPASAVSEGEGAAAAAGGARAGGEQLRRLSRVPSMAFERLRSFNLSRFAAPAPEPAVAGVMDLGYEQPALPVEKQDKEVEVEREHEHTHMERSRSETAAEAELPRLPARLHKSASEKSAFAHFEAEEVEEAVQAVEARRPATTREGAARRGRRLPDPVADTSESESEPEEEAAAAGGGEVDARADDFINRFHHQLKLQRMASILRYRETIRRGHAAAAAAAAGGV